MKIKVSNRKPQHLTAEQELAEYQRICNTLPNAQEIKRIMSDYLTYCQIVEIEKMQQLEQAPQKWDLGWAYPNSKGGNK